MNNKLIFLVIVFLGFLPSAFAQQNDVPVINSSFENGDQNMPQGWKPVGKGKTNWERQGLHGRAISVEATETGNSLYWTSEPLKLKKLTFYKMSFWSKHQGIQRGAIIAGTNGINRNFPVGDERWQQHSYVFMSPDNTDDIRLVLGQWNGKGKVLFDEVSLQEVSPLYHQEDGLQLSLGEHIAGNVYTYQTDPYPANYYQGLESINAGFNTNRWIFSKDASLIYHHRVGNLTQIDGKVSVIIGYYQSGKLIIEASKDGKQWVQIASRKKAGQFTVPLPADLYPATNIYIRLRAATTTPAGVSQPGSFQVNEYAYRATIKEPVPDMNGDTHFLQVNKSSHNVNVRVQNVGSFIPGEKNALQLNISSPQKLTDLKATLSFATAKDPGAKVLLAESAPNILQSSTTLSLPYVSTQSGELTYYIDIYAGQQHLYSATSDIYMPEYYAADYGDRIGDYNDIWWAASTYKIRRERIVPPPAERSDAISIQLARNEYEAAQMVINPQKDITNFDIKAPSLKGPNGAVLDSDHITINQVDYLHIDHPTDSTGTVDWWPDPLLPFKKGANLTANINHPFWITVFAPKDTPAGIYTGTLVLTANNWQREVPLKINIWNFTLSDETHIKTALGINIQYIQQYHHVNEAQLGELTAKYSEDFASHRISPYGAGYDPLIKVDWGFKPLSQWKKENIDRSTSREGKNSLRIEDKNEKGNTEIVWPSFIKVNSGQPYSLKFAAKTLTDEQPFQLSINTYDIDQKWISGRNLNVTLKGTTSWKNYQVDLTKHLNNPQIQFIKIVLRAAPWSTTGEQTGTTWFDNIQLLDQENQDILQGSGNFEEQIGPVTPGQVKLDFSEFDSKVEERIKKYHINTFRLKILGSGSGSASTYWQGIIGPYRQGSSEYDILFGSYLKQLQDHLEKKGWLDKAFLYWFDEPQPSVYARVREMGDLIHSYAPKLKWMLTLQPEPELGNSVAIWCPVLSNFEQQSSSDLQKQGKEVWWYICTVPRAPYVGEFIDRSAIEPRLWLWQAWQNKVQGILIWNTVYWNDQSVYPDSLQNPRKDAMSWSHSGTKWGNGDGRFLYPPKRDPNTDQSADLGAPVNSIRWEMLRDGIEDYEYFYTLQKMVVKLEKQNNLRESAREWLSNAKELLRVPNAVSTTLTDFSKTPTSLLNHRAKIAQAIINGRQFVAE